MQDKTFNIIISGVGGQGVITMLSLIDEAVFIDGYDVKSSELHGLSQRGGSVLAHVRLGKKVYSPLVQDGRADLIIGLELLEGLMVIKYIFPVLGGLPQKEIVKKLNESFTKKMHIIEASDICKAKLQNEVVGAIYLLGYAVGKNLIPIKKESILKAIENIVPEKYRELNIKAFNLAYGDN